MQRWRGGEVLRCRFRGSDEIQRGRGAEVQSYRGGAEVERRIIGAWCRGADVVQR